MADITGEDRGRIHARAWRDPEFRHLLETDPTEAIKRYGREQRPPKTFDKIVMVRPRPVSIPDAFLEDVNPFPPSCC